MLICRAVHRTRHITARCSSSNVSLAYTKYGTSGVDAPPHAPVLFLHGVFGSKINFSRTAKRLAEDLETECYTLDCRNHGASPWTESMTLLEMCGDVVAFVEQHQLGPVHLVGHSLGGKQACLMCALHPKLVRSAVIVDMFPVTFTSNVLHNTCTSLSLLNLDILDSREEAAHLLASQIPSAAERSFILSNLHRSKAGWKWRCNLPTIHNYVSEVRAFPEDLPVADTNTLFLYGGASDYASESRIERTKELFTAASFIKIENAGHIVHLDQPEHFYRAVSDFIKH